MNCKIIQDMLPNYIDGLSSEETNQEVKKHLGECEDCRKIYETMSISFPKEKESNEKSVDFLKNIREKLHKKNILITVLICAIIVVGFCVFAKSYEVVLPYDSNRMFVEKFQAAVVPDENGGIQWLDKNSELFKEDIPKDCEETIDLLRISYKGINRFSENSRGKNINRNGEDVWVVYYCYYKTLWDSWFYDADRSEESGSGSNYGSNIYGEDYENPNYKPQKREIYYLPIKNIHKIENLSEEEFDHLREKAYLIWKGVI